MIYLLTILLILLQDTHQLSLPRFTTRRDFACICMKNGPTKPKGIKGIGNENVHMKNAGSRPNKGIVGADKTNNGGKPLEYDTLRSSSANFVKAMKYRSHDSNAGDISREERAVIYALLSLHSPGMPASLLASTVYSLGMFSQNTKTRMNLREETRLLQAGVHLIASQLSMYDAVSLVVGMARMQAQWGEICKDESLSYRLSNFFPSMDDRSVGDTVWAIGSMGARWNELPKSLQYNIILALEREGLKLNSFSLSSALWSMAKMGAKWSYFSKELRQNFIKRAMELGPLMSPQQSSKLVWAIGTMGSTYDEFPEFLLEYHVINVGKIKRSQVGFAVSASQTLTGVAKTGINWEKMSVLMRSSLLDQLMRVCQSNNDRGIANGVWAMGTIGIPMTSLPEEIKDLMLLSSANIMKECSSWALCNIVWGLAKMKFTWNDLPRSFKNAIILNTKRIEKEMNNVDVGILIWSLGALDTPLDTLPSDFVEALLLAALRNLETMRAQELARTIWGLSGSGLSWDSIPAPVRWSINVALRRVGEEMSPQDVANSAYGLALLAFDSQTPQDAAFRGCHEVLLNIIRKTQRTADSIAAMNEQELEQIRIFSHYLKVMNYVIDVRRIPAQLLSSANDVVNMDNVQGSRLQRKVVRALRDAFDSSELSEQYEIALEVSSFDGAFPVDAAISKKGKIVALLEVDGPSHYRPDGRLRRKDKLKEAMYMSKHVESAFHRVRWDEAELLGSKVVGAELAALVMSSNIEIDAFTRIRQSIQKAIKKFVNWCLRNTHEN